MWDGDPPWTLPGVEGKKAKGKGKKIPTHFSESSVCDHNPLWTLPRIKGEKAEEKGKKVPTPFTKNFSFGTTTFLGHSLGKKVKKQRKREKFLTHYMEISVWDDDPPWTLPGVEGKKAEDREKKLRPILTEISVWDDDPPWTPPGVEGKKAEEKGKKCPALFTEIQCGTTTLHGLCLV